MNPNSHPLRCLKGVRTYNLVLNFLFVIYPFNKYLFGAYYVAGTVMGAGHTVSSWSLYFSGGRQAIKNTYVNKIMSIIVEKNKIEKRIGRIEMKDY